MLSERARSVLVKAGVATAVAVLTVALAENVVIARRPGPRPRFRRWPEPEPELGPGILDIDSEASDDPEPADLVYADDEPCEIPPHPWEQPVASPYPKLGDATGCVPPADLEPLQRTAVPFADVGDPRWPLTAKSDPKLRVSYEDVRGLFHGKYGRHMGATRTSTNANGESYKRVHVGVDLFAGDGDVVLATEPGTVLAALPYYKGTGALYVLTDSGIVVNYGELKMGSWKEFGIKAGQSVETGQRIARVGVSNDGSHMLHVETFRPETTVDEIRRGDLRWIAGDDPPPNVLDPTRYLVRARQATLEEA